MQRKSRNKHQSIHDKVNGFLWHEGDGRGDEYKNCGRMINLYSYLYPQLESQGCNTCTFQAIFHDNNDVKIKVYVHASICAQSEVMVTAKNAQHEIFWQRQIDINCQPEACPFSDLSDLR